MPRTSAAIRRRQVRRRQGATVALEVSNDGPGVTGSSVQEGIGLGNTRARLEALYPRPSSLELIDLPGRGARVIVRLPFRTPAASR